MSTPRDSPASGVASGWRRRAAPSSQSSPGRSGSTRPRSDEMAGSRSLQAGARKRAFLDAFRLSGNVSAAARAAKVDRSTPYGWKDDDARFATAWEDAEQESIDRLEEEARRRAEAGTDEYVVSGGKLIYADDGTPLLPRRYSDSLMALLLKAHRPEKYKDRAAHEVTGKDGGPIDV